MHLNASPHFRGNERTRVNLAAKVTCRSETTSATVVDVSDEGMSFQLSYDIRATPGQVVSIDSTEFGRMTGTVRWARGDKIGVRLITSTNTAAKIAAFHKFFR